MDKSDTKVFIEIIRKPDNQNSDSSGYRTFKCLVMGLWLLKSRDLLDRFQILCAISVWISNNHPKTRPWCLILKWHLMQGQFANKTYLDHLKSGLVQYSSGGSNTKHSKKNIQIQDPFQISVFFCSYLGWFSIRMNGTIATVIATVIAIVPTI